MTYEKRRSKKKAQMNLDHCRRRSANAFKTQYRRYRRAEKNHPCGGKTFEIMRAGMDFRIRCLQCGSQMRLSRPKLEKSVVRIISPKEKISRD